MNSVQIDGKFIGHGNTCYIIAEMSGNHNQSYQKAVEIIHAAKEVGADAIKLQTYTPDTITINCDNKYFRIQNESVWSGQTLYELYQKAYTPWEWQPGLKEEADKIGMTFFSTPFDTTAVDFLTDMDVPAFKIASFELIDLPLIEYIAMKGKPVIMSTGMGTLTEIKEAVQAIRKTGNSQLILLKCVSDYPSLPEDMNLQTIPDIAENFGVPVGLSDHTTGLEVSIAAVALGACVIEKHLTLERADGGPDASFSMEPREFKAMVRGIRLIEKSLGSVRYEPTDRELQNKLFRRSLFVVEDMKAGDSFNENNIRSIRPSFGLHPRFYNILIGKKVSRDVKKGTPVTWDIVLNSGDTNWEGI